MATLVAEPRRDEEGNGSQYRHFIEGWKEGVRGRGERGEEIIVIHIHEVYPILLTRPPVVKFFLPSYIEWRESQGDTQLAVHYGLCFPRRFFSVALCEGALS